MLEHLFVGELLRELWRRGPVRAEVMRPLVDDAGYDVVIETNGNLRHIQLKASFRGSRTTSQNANIQLGLKPSGCVVWIRFDKETLDLGPFFFFGRTTG